MNDEWRERSAQAPATTPPGSQAHADGAAAAGVASPTSTRSRRFSRLTSLHHLNHGVPLQFHRPPSSHHPTPAVSRQASTSASGTATRTPTATHNTEEQTKAHQAADPYNETFSEVDINYAAKAAADHAYSIWFFRESNWDTNRTSELTSTSILHDIRSPTLWRPHEVSALSQVHYLLDIEKRTLIRGLHDLEKVRKHERDESDKRRAEERAKEKIRRKVTPTRNETKKEKKRKVRHGNSISLASIAHVLVCVS